MIDHILEHEKCALWVEMGLGKTIATLTALQKLKARFEANRILVIAPLRVASMVWPQEIKEWPHITLTIACVLGNEKKRIEALRTKADIHIINRENVRWLVDIFVKNNVVQKWPWDTVVLDEASSFKARSSWRWKYLRKCSAHINNMIQLTGTPAPNGIEDLWAQMFLLDDGERLGRTLTSFRSRWMEQNPYSFKRTPRPNADYEVHERVSDIALSMKAEDYLELPDVIENQITVTLTKKEQEQYRTMRRDYILQMQDGTKITAVHAGALWNKLAQLSNGAVYSKHPEWSEFHTHKIKALLELHEELDGPAIVVYNYIPDYERIEIAFNSAKIKWRLMDTKKDEEDWNNGLIDRLVLHPASAGHGLNLYKNGCRNIVWFGLTPNLEHYQQVIARIAGGLRALHGNKPIVVHKIVAAMTQDRDLDDMLKTKGQHQDVLMTRTRKLFKQYA